VNFINFEPANCGTQSTRDFLTRGISLTNGMIRNTRFTDCLAHSAISTCPRLGKVENVLDQFGLQAQRCAYSGDPSVGCAADCAVVLMIHRKTCEVTQT